MKESEKIYLHLYIAQSGLTSRRKAEGLIRSGRVKVNNKKVLIPEFKVHPEDIVLVDGKRIGLEREKVYYLLNKPEGVLSTVLDKRGKKTVLDLLPSGVKTKRVYPVGRLDKDTTGILILTNDGELTYRLTHPRFKVEKAYLVFCQGSLERGDVSRLEKGIEIDGKKTLPAKVSDVSFRKEKNETSLLIKIREGRKRQIKNMFFKIGHPVTSLERIEFAGLRLKALKRGQVRPLKEDEVEFLKNKVKL